MRTHKLKKLVAGLIAATMLLNAGATAVHAAESGDSIMESQDAQRIEDALSPEDATTIESRSQLKEKTLLNAPLRASQQIRTFGIQFVYGAENQGGKLVWTPKTPDSGHKFVFRVNYALSGIGENPADALHITIPKHILKNRNGSFADIADVAVPSARQVAG